MSWSRENPRYRRSSALARRKKKKGFFSRLDNWLRGRKDRSKIDTDAKNVHHRPEPPIPPQLLEELKIAVPRPKPPVHRPAPRVCPRPDQTPAAAGESPESGHRPKVSLNHKSIHKRSQPSPNIANQLDSRTEAAPPEGSTVDHPLIENVSAVASGAVTLDRAEVKTIRAAGCQEPNIEKRQVKLASVDVPDPKPLVEAAVPVTLEAASRAERPIDYAALRAVKRRKRRIAATMDRSAFFRWGLVLGLVALLAIGLGLGWSYFSQPVPRTAKVARIPVANLPKVPPLSPGFFELYAREKESMVTTETVISQGSGLGQALEAVGLGAPQISLAIIECLTKEGGINPASVRAGVTLKAVWSDRGRAELSRLEYLPEIGAAPLVVMPKADGGFWLYDTASPPMTLSAAREAVVETSLWQAGSAVGLDANVIMSLSDILASDVDFLTDIKKGDTFQVLYSREYRDGLPRGVPVIDMVKLVNKGREFEYYRFVDHNNKVGYYDPDGRTSQKDFFVSPLQYKRISSGFSMNRLHPIYKVVRPHQGVDYAAPAGTPVSTVAAGTVIFAGWNGGYGRLVTIRHDDTYTTMYAHLSRFAPGITKGVKVNQGDLIGHVGATGAATGPHLDFRMKKNGNFIDPLPELAKQQGRKLESGDYVDLTKAISLIRHRMTEQLASGRGGV